MRLAANVKMIQDIAPFNFKFILFRNRFNDWIQFVLHSGDRLLLIGVNRLLVHAGRFVEDVRVKEGASASQNVLGLLVDRRSHFLVDQRLAGDLRHRELETDSIREVRDLQHLLARTATEFASVGQAVKEVLDFVCSFAVFALFHSDISISHSS